MPGTSSNSPLPNGSQLIPLEAQLDTYDTSTHPRGCLVTIRNNTTAERHAMIVGAGVYFRYYRSTPAANGADGSYMAGPVPIEVPPGAAVPFRFSDPRYFVFDVGVGVRVMFGNPNGFPSASFENFFWETKLSQPLINPPPPYPQIAEVHLDFRMIRQMQPPTPPVGTPQGPLTLADLPARWPPIPGAAVSKPGVKLWFELAERPQ